MVLQRRQLADLDVVTDELFLEADGPRRKELALHLFMHAFYRSDLSTRAKRLLAFSSRDYTTQMHVGKALAVDAYHRDDGTLVTALLASPFRMHVLQVDHRARVGAGVIGALAAFAAQAEPTERQAAFLALQRLGKAGADLHPAIDVLCAALGAKPSGRGYKKVDLDLHARSALSAIARKTLVAELARRAPTAKPVQAFLDTLRPASARPAPPAKKPRAR